MDFLNPFPWFSIASISPGRQQMLNSLVNPLNRQLVHRQFTANARNRLAPFDTLPQILGNRIEPNSMAAFLHKLMQPAHTRYLITRAAASSSGVVSHFPRGHRRIPYKNNFIVGSNLIQQPFRIHAFRINAGWRLICTIVWAVMEIINLKFAKMIGFADRLE